MAKHIPIRQVVLDIETTGLDVASGDRIIEIAVVEILNSHVSGKHLHIYINPERDIDLGAVAIHGISLDMLLDKPKFSEVAKQVTEFIRGAELIAHNAPFDVGFLNKELSLLGLSPIEELCPSVVDTLAMARKQRPKQKNNISALCAAYAINTARKNLHGALLDAFLLAELYLALTRKTLH
jgi:DNA polymerase-3 subunit epsilon